MNLEKRSFWGRLSQLVAQKSKYSLLIMHWCKGDSACLEMGVLFFVVVLFFAILLFALEFDVCE